MRKSGSFGCVVMTMMTSKNQLSLMCSFLLHYRCSPDSMMTVVGPLDPHKSTLQLEKFWVSSLFDFFLSLDFTPCKGAISAISAILKTHPPPNISKFEASFFGVPTWYSRFLFPPPTSLFFFVLMQFNGQGYVSTTWTAQSEAW